MLSSRARVSRVGQEHPVAQDLGDLGDRLVGALAVMVRDAEDQFDDVDVDEGDVRPVLRDALAGGPVDLLQVFREAPRRQRAIERERCSVVFGVPDAKWGAACVVLREVGSVGGDELAAFLSARLAKYKVPKRWLILDALPRTAYGKVLENDLRERLMSARQR
jgi:acyl-CoA synthetase (AMP-forming)/AMP-acid ligase II